MTEFASSPDKNFKRKFLLKTYSHVADSHAETDAMEDTPLLPGGTGLTTDLLPEIFTMNPDTANRTHSPRATTTSMELLPHVPTFLNTLLLLVPNHVFLDTTQPLRTINNSELSHTLLLELKTSNKKSLLTDLLKPHSPSMKTF